MALDIATAACHIVFYDTSLIIEAFDVSTWKAVSYSFGRMQFGVGSSRRCLSQRGPWTGFHHCSGSQGEKRPMPV